MKILGKVLDIQTSCDLKKRGGGFFIFRQNASEAAGGFAEPAKTLNSPPWPVERCSVQCASKSTRRREYYPDWVRSGVANLDR